MKAVCLIDTSIFVNILGIPSKSSNFEGVIEEMTQKIDEQEFMFLPMATLFETGNHIGQNGDGNQRRQCANKFVKQVQLALAGESPFVPIDFVEADRMRRWLDEFPDWVGHQCGLGDLSIKHDWERLCAQNPGRRVYVWSLDEHLAAFDQLPPL